MPTVMTHAALALGLGRAFTARRMPLSFWTATAGLAMLPDIDVLAFRFGIPYDAFLGHRGFSHSLVFALAAGGLAAMSYRYFAMRFWDLMNFFFLAAASHGILDAFTNGGLGVAFFAPFDNTRYFFPWRPIEVSPIGLAFFSSQGLQTAWTELLYVWLPIAALVVVVEIVRRVREPPKQPGAS